MNPAVRRSLVRPALRALLLVFAASTMAGCAGYLGPAGRTSSRSSLAAPTCRPSQHWDGNQCRHNGRGNGARKHDGPRM